MSGTIRSTSGNDEFQSSVASIEYLVIGARSHHAAVFVVRVDIVAAVPAGFDARQFHGCSRIGRGR